MTTPRRFRNVRVSVRPQVEAKDAAWKTPNKTYPHARYQRLFILEALSGERLLRAREVHDASWEAQARDRPVITDHSRIVVLDAAGADILTLEVVKVHPDGGFVRLQLKDITEQQPVAAG